MKKLLLVVGVGMLLAGCGNSEFEKMMDQGKTAVENGDFAEAEKAFELALEEKPEDTEALASYEQMTQLNQVKTVMDETKWDEALTEIDSILKDDSLAETLETEYEKYKETALENKEEKQTASAPAKRKTDESAASGKGPASTKTESAPAQSNKESVAAPGKTESAPLPALTEKEPARTKNQYLQYLDEVEKGLGDLDHLYKSGTTIELLEAESEAHQRWDAALNEIYGVLKKQLPEKDMDKLRDDQRQWIEFRNKKAKEDAAEFEGGSFASVQYASTLQQLTKERCYELVNDYMK